MKPYQTALFDDAINCCFELDEKLRAVLEKFVKFYEYSELEHYLLEIKSDYSRFKTKLLRAVTEIKINLLELDDELQFKKYQKYLEIKISSISGVISPEELQDRLDEEYINEISGTFLDSLIVCEVPEVLDYFTIGSFLYTYSFLLKVYCNALTGVFRRMNFKEVDNFDTTFFEPANKQVERVKLKTTLSVPQLAYLFKVLANREFFEFRQKKDIYQFVIDNFSTKGMNDISFHSFKNKYETPEFDAIDFLHEKFIHCAQYAHKDKGSFGS